MAILSMLEERANGSKVYWGTAAPLSTDGTFEIGDMVVRSTPTAGGPDYWICTVAGTPGTWKAAANIAA
jgi:hypothetical protein